MLICSSWIGTVDLHKVHSRGGTFISHVFSCINHVFKAYLCFFHPVDGQNTKTIITLDIVNSETIQLLLSCESILTGAMLTLNFRVCISMSNWISFGLLLFVTFIVHLSLTRLIMSMTALLGRKQFQKVQIISFTLVPHTQARLFQWCWFFFSYFRIELPPLLIQISFPDT